MWPKNVEVKLLIRSHRVEHFRTSRGEIERKKLSTNYRNVRNPKAKCLVSRTLYQMFSCQDRENALLIPQSLGQWVLSTQIIAVIYWSLMAGHKRKGRSNWTVQSLNFNAHSICGTNFVRRVRLKFKLYVRVCIRVIAGSNWVGAMCGASTIWRTGRYLNSGQALVMNQKLEPLEHLNPWSRSSGSA